MRSSQVQSRWRNVFAKPAQSSEQFRGVQLGSLFLEENPLEVGARYVAVPWNEPRGAVAVVPRKPHALDAPPTLTLAGGPINSFALAPSDDARVLCACEDGSVALFVLGPEGLTASRDDPTAQMSDGHDGKRVLGARWHPHVENLAATHCGGKTVALWDVGAEALHSRLPAAPQLLQSLELRAAHVLTLAKDKALRVHDVRQGGAPTHTAATVHAGARGGHAAWLNDHCVLSVGYSATAREAKRFDLRKGLDKPAAVAAVDGQSASALFATVDEDLQMAYVWGKGDGNMRIFDTADGLLDCAETKSSVAQSGLALLPRRLLDAHHVKDGTVAVVYKLTPNALDVLQMQMPRASDFFDEALHPAAPAGQPRAVASAFLAGADLAPEQRVSLQPK